ncbi:pullulanase [Pseudobutyrivibrio sp. YE44]|uniref:type I pullulanase n=1 Tax=Pseudobutyrivibrio sp. YE44 TaxID=1520802 RepID=UPI0008816602|nr:type I pullulanase [Pseudobutyrivibrio sp. YE44]SDB23330.1 pullulanase [Pseudobutyrivibrio sp. YE44]
MKKEFGAIYGESVTTFSLWSPTVNEAFVNLYSTGDYWKKDLIKSLPMKSEEDGVWSLEVEENLAGVYYTYTVVINGKSIEACDPYAKAVGVNGQRAMVIDLASTNPEGWSQDKNPHAGDRITDAVVYELHVRDFSIDESGNIPDKGRYTAFCHTGTKTDKGNPTGIDYIKDLGVTHVQLMPIYDYGSVDERDDTDSQYNWGYDPVNYNVPEGSYSSNPYDGAVRVREAKEMIKALHDAGLSVVMDVVYNHVYSGDDFCFNKLTSGYFSRINSKGVYSNGSECGNDTASERPMVRKFIVDSVCYWADEYHIDGFRFDLVGLLDVDTINEIVSEVHKNHPDVIFYGEGWTMSTEVTKKNVTLATQEAAGLTPGFGYFNDNMRDGLKGSVFEKDEIGWATGAKKMEKQMANSFMAKEPWSCNPSQIVQYTSCHDNNTLIDRIAISRPDVDRKTLIKMNNLCAAFYMLAAGMPLMQAGEEMLRSKVKEDGSFESNSYKSSDAVNAIKWSNVDKEEYRRNIEYYKKLIAFRKKHGLLRLESGEEVSKNVKPLKNLPKNVLAFHFENKDGEVVIDDAKEIYIAFNPNATSVNISLPEEEDSLFVPPISAEILVNS